jgi:hypothetical protein
MAPECDVLDDEFVSDCVVWSLFSASNQTVSMKDVTYKREKYQLHNHLFPFLLSKVKSWKCSLITIQDSIASAKDDRFAANWLSAHQVSQEASVVLSRAETVYMAFYENLTSLPYPKYKISYWDAGLYQIKSALREAGLIQSEVMRMNDANKELGKKILPQLYTLGFLQGQEHMFEDELHDD